MANKWKDVLNERSLIANERSKWSSWKCVKVKGRKTCQGQMFCRSKGIMGRNGRNGLMCLKGLKMLNGVYRVLKCVKVTRLNKGGKDLEVRKGSKSLRDSKGFKRM